MDIEAGHGSSSSRTGSRFCRSAMLVLATVCLTVATMFLLEIDLLVSETECLQQTPQMGGLLADTRGCGLSFLGYVSSPWEAEWIQNVSEWDSDAEMCKHMPPEKITQFMSGTRRAQASQCGHILQDLGEGPNKEIFSYYRYGDTCTGMLVEVFIDPLVGLLRSPQCPCASGNAALLDRDYIIYGLASESCQNTKEPKLTSVSKGKQLYMFDLGASLYTEGAGGASQKVFVDSFTELGVPLSNIHYFAWEVTPSDPTEVWKQVPAELKPKYHWLNIPSDPTPGSGDNPWSYIKALCKQADYVVVKLDIDNSPVETAFMQQLLADADLQGLIDEMFFEHHVNVEHMNPSWNTYAETAKLKDSYAWFVQLRNAGVRMHGWP